MEFRKARSFSRIFLATVLMILSAALFTAGADSADAVLVPSSFLKFPEKGSDYAILVDKTQQKVFVYKKGDLSTPLKIYPCSTGENDGKKGRQKDRKTPEGVYFFVNVFDQKDLAPIYGVRAFPLDYPNPMDKREGRDGYGIWLHGLNKPLKPKDTNGCVALENHNIEDISAYIRLNDTPVIISSKPEMVESEKLQKEREELEKVVEGWRKAWEAKQVDRYMSYYSPRFTSGKMDWKGYKEYKARLARQYKEIRVKLNNLALYKNDGVVMAAFSQQYSTAAFDSIGLKRLYLQQNSKDWKIVGEYFDNPEDRPVIAVAALPKKPAPAPEEKPAAPARKASSAGEIKAFIESWRKTWEKKDLRAYIACYDPSFSSRGMDLSEWKRHREGLNEQHQSLTIEFKDMKIQEIAGDSAKVTFVQDYRADAYRDTGVKSILLTKRGAHWKIKKEEWRALRKPRR